MTEKKKKSNYPSLQLNQRQEEPAFYFADEV